MLLLLSGCADLIADKIADKYTPVEQSVAVGTVWPPLAATGAADEWVLGGASTTRVGREGTLWTYDLTWNLTLLDGGGGALSGAEDELVLGWDEWASEEGDVYRIVDGMDCAPAEAAPAPDTGRLRSLLDTTAAAAEADPDGEHRDRVGALLESGAGGWEAYGLGAWADGSTCVPGDVALFEAAGEPWPADPAAWDPTLDGLRGCEEGARHYLYDALAAGATALGAELDGGGDTGDTGGDTGDTGPDTGGTDTGEGPSPPAGALFAWAAGPDAGSTTDPAVLAELSPPVFELRAGSVEDLLDELRLTQGTDGALIVVPEDGMGGGFAGMQALWEGGRAGYRCTARMEIETIAESRHPAWLTAWTYLPPTETRVQVSVPWLLRFDSD